MAALPTTRSSLRLIGGKGLKAVPHVNPTVSEHEAPVYYNNVPVCKAGHRCGSQGQYTLDTQLT